MRPLRYIIVHCSATDSGNANIIRKYHIEHNRWSDIGYHFVITTEGKVEPGRPVDQIGAHCQGFNRNSIGICLIGLNKFYEVQFDALRHLLSNLEVKYGRLDIKPHNYFPSAIRQGKTCPNFDVYKVAKGLVRGAS